MITALNNFLAVLSTLVAARSDVDEDVVRFLNLSSIAVRAGDTGRQALEDATTKMRQLVAEGRSLDAEESAALDDSIASKLARAAAVDLDEDPPPAG